MTNFSYVTPLRFSLSVSSKYNNYHSFTLYTIPDANNNLYDYLLTALPSVELVNVIT